MIEYTSTHPSMREIGDLEGFFEGWPESPGPTMLVRVLSSSDVCLLARDTEQRDRIVGIAAAITDSVLSAQITLLEVLASHRGRGIGTELVRRALAELKRFYAIDVVCDPELEGFYERLGFQHLTAMSLRNPERIAPVREEPFGWVEREVDHLETGVAQTVTFEFDEEVDEETAEAEVGGEDRTLPWIQARRGSRIVPVITAPVVLHGGESLTVWISSIEVADEGFSITLSARAASEGAGLLDAFGWSGGPQGYSRYDHERGREIVRSDLPDELFRFGLRFADGGEVSNVDQFADRQRDWDQPPAGAVMSEHGSGGGGREYDSSYWIWPLPPAGRTTAWCEWPAGGVARTEVELDTEAIRRAAQLT